MEQRHFTRMEAGTDEDFQVLTRLHERTSARLPDRLMGMVNDLSGDQADNNRQRRYSAVARAAR